MLHCLLRSHGPSRWLGLLLLVSLACAPAQAEVTAELALVRSQIVAEGGQDRGHRVEALGADIDQRLRQPITG